MKKTSYHFAERYKDRALNEIRQENNQSIESACRKKEINSIVMAAKHNGISLGMLRPYCPELSDYIKKKCHTQNTKIKLYRGFIFIWCGRSKVATTIYKIPDKYKEEYEEALKKYEENKKANK